MKRDHGAPHLNKQSIHELPRRTADLNGSKRRWPCNLAKSGSAAPAVKEMGDNEDLIEDDYDSYDELFARHFTDEKLSQLDGTEAVPTQDKPPISFRTKSGQKPTNNAKRFILRSKNSQDPKLQNEQKEKLPWAQRYAPQTLEELAVHKKKVSDVEQWLNNALTGKSRKNLLVLKGPAGSGKTATISLLSDKLKFNVLEWKPPSGSEYGGKDYVSLGAQFDGFLSRSHKFRSLRLDTSDGAQSPMKDNHFQRRIILIEEFPTLSGPTASVLAAFRLSILRYISMDAPHFQTGYYSGETGIPPIVIIVSESYSNPESSLENLTVHRLLGREISNHPRTSVIEFNSIAPTFMSKALKLVLKKSACQPMVNQTSTQLTINAISMIGDIRNAIASLEFFCLGTDNRWSGEVHSATNIKDAGRSRKKIPPVNSETRILSQREAGLGLFHAVGKIIYNKRNGGTDTENPQDPDRPGVSQVHVNELLNETGTDIQSFIGALHENYVPSCNGPSFTRCLDDCILSLSDSDVLCVDRRGLNRPQSGFGTNFVKPGTGVDFLRQEEISYQVAVRGLLLCLPYPVKRQVSRTGSASHSNNPHKLSFPPVIQLTRQFEETRNIIDSWGNALLSSTGQLSAVLLLGHAGSTSHRSTRAEGVGFQNNGSEISTSVAVPIARNDLILHQLPYMTMILEKGVGSRSAQKNTSPETRGPKYRLQQDALYAWGSSASGFRKLGLETQSTQLERQALAVSQAGDGQLFLEDDDIVDDP